MTLVQHHETEQCFCLRTNHYRYFFAGPSTIEHGEELDDVYFNKRFLMFHHRWLVLH